MRVLVTPRSFAKTDRRPLELLEAAGCEVIRNPRGEILSREEMLALVREVAPTLFAHAGPSCVAGPCPEGKMSCGRMAQMRERYR